MRQLFTKVCFLALFHAPATVKQLPLASGPTTWPDSTSTVSARFVVDAGSGSDPGLSIFLFDFVGLHRDDCLYENEDVKEAIRRLPEKLKDERNFRITRALHLSMTKTILPKEQWTKYEEDTKYLEPYLDEVVREREEKVKWESNK